MTHNRVNHAKFIMAVPVQIREKVSFQKDVYTSLIRGLLKQRSFGELCDVTLRLNGRFFFAHKAVLAAASPYFRSMFTSCMKEQTSADVDLSRSLSLDYEDSFKQILDFMYTGELELTIDNAEDILRIADFLLLEEVKSYCREFYIVHGNLNLSNCLRMTALSEHHNMPDIAMVAKGMVQSRFHDYHVHSEEILELPEQYFQTLLKDPQTVQFTSSDNLVKAILRWMQYDERSRCGSLSKILSCVNMQSLTVDVVRKLVKLATMDMDSSLMMKLGELENLQAKYATYKKLSVNENTNECGEDAVVPRDATEPVIFATNCNTAVKYTKLALYRVREQRWYQVPLNFDAILCAIPPRLNMCSSTLVDGILYIFLSYNLPYPTDMLRIHILEINLWSGQHTLLTFYHRHRTTECCQTTLTDDRAVPPTMVYSNGYLCIVGNMEGSGQVYLCDIASQTYMCYQIPGTRFVSLARSVAKGDQLYIWCRHRFGHEEYCINKEVTFAVFNIVDKSFEINQIPPPPSIGYGEFGDMHVMCVEDKERVVIHTPGKFSLYLDESRGGEWVTSPRRFPAFTNQRMPTEMPYHGHQVYTHCDRGVYIFENPAAVTTSLTCLCEGQLDGIANTPAPMDGISMVTTGELPSSFICNFPPAEHFDDAYTKLIHNRVAVVDYDTEGTGTPHSGLSDTEEDYEYDGYEYDDDIYGYYDGYGY